MSDADLNEKVFLNTHQTKSIKKKEAVYPSGGEVFMWGPWGMVPPLEEVVILLPVWNDMQL